MIRPVALLRGFAMLAKVLFAAIAMTLALVVMRRLMERANASRVKVRTARPPVPARQAVVLREDPRTGVWRED